MRLRIFFVVFLACILAAPLSAQSARRVGGGKVKPYSEKSAKPAAGTVPQTQQRNTAGSKKPDKKPVAAPQQGAQRAKTVGQTRRPEAGPAGNTAESARAVGASSIEPRDAGNTPARSVGRTREPSADAGQFRSKTVGSAQRETFVSGSLYSSKIQGFTLDEQLTQEISLKVGAAIPLSNIKLQGPVGESGFYRGAKTGAKVAFTYHFYPIPQLFIGGHINAHLLGYDFNGLSAEGAKRYNSSGWNCYSLSAVIGPRIPLGIYGLYFTAHAGVGFGLMTSPYKNAVFVVPAPTEKHPERTRLQTQNLLAGYISCNAYLTGGIAVEYRFKQRFIAKVFLDYDYTPVTALGSNQRAPWRDSEVPGTVPGINLSTMNVGVGINYAF